MRSWSPLSNDVSDGLYPPVGDIDQVYHPGQAVLHALLLQSPWRLGTARPNVQHGAGAPHGHFSPMRRSTRVLCAHGRLSAREELQDISRTPETQPTPHLLRIPPPLIPVKTTERRKKILRYELLGLMQILDRQGQAHRHISQTQ